MKRIALSIILAIPALPSRGDFFEQHCLECHDAETKKGGLDLTALKQNLSDPENFARWVKIHDRIESGEMPPKKKARPPSAEVRSYVAALSESLVKAEKLDAEGRTGLRRLTRVEYENTVRDLFDLPGIALQAGLPSDGSAHGFDTNSDALDISHVNMAKYIEAADKTLDMAIATRPEAPPVEKVRLSLAGNYEPDIQIMSGDAMLLRDKQLDPDVPPAGKYAHVNQGAHESLGLFEKGSSVGVFKHEDETWNAYFRKFVALYPGRYHVKASYWGMWWDKGKILPARGVEAARLSVVQFNDNGRGGQHPSYVVGYYDAPSLESKVHELDVWLNTKEGFGYNSASLAHVVLYRVGTWGQVDRTMGFTGPCVVSDWLEVEGPLHDVWPPRGHRVLFGDTPLTEFKGARPPVRKPLKQEVIGTNNRAPQEKGVWTVQPEQPLVEADRLLASFLPKAFRRQVTEDIRQQYVTRVDERLKAGDCFESAMRWAYRAALCSPHFLYHIEPVGRLDEHALAAKLSYFLWNSAPNETLKCDHATVERMLKDPKSQRFIENFLAQWLKLSAIAANDPDKKLYPEFSPYLQDSMVSETHAYFRELIENDLDASYLVQSDFAMLNEKLAVHCGIPGVSGPKIRRVKLPKDCPRGGFLTQASILKITANGTTTSPVVRGAYVMARLLGKPPEPPPPNVPAVEPDVQGATTIRELLDKHRDDSSCASCHAQIDPPGFALESFDVIGGQRERYRSLNEKGDPAPRGSIDPKIGISFKLGPQVDASGQISDEKKFSGIAEFKTLLAADKHLLLKNLAQQLLIYATGRPVAFSDRAALNDILNRSEKKGGGIRTLIHEIVLSPLFQTR